MQSQDALNNLANAISENLDTTAGMLAAAVAGLANIIRTNSMLSGAALSAGATLEGLFAQETGAIAGGFGEISLFRALSASLAKWRIPNLIETRECHGRSFQVEHRTAKPFAHLGLQWCELCDLAVVSYSPTTNEARVTFLQAKFERSHVPDTGAGLQANMVQWSLLGTRARLTKQVSTIVPALPPDLLSAAASPSVGSFGFFHRSGTAIEMAFASADLLQVAPPRARSPKGKSGRLSFPAPGVAFRVGPPVDLCLASRVRDFAAGLAMMLIGTPITPQSALAAWVTKLVHDKMKRSRHDPVLAGLLGVLGEQPPSDGEGSDPDVLTGNHPSLVVIQTGLARPPGSLDLADALEPFDARRL